ncbi:MAG: hypothetical protein JSS32_07235 [Verrucomicrobia bacterium]|nr:hypothetical protein [Verrucomicrobiota bacterium]
MSVITALIPSQRWIHDYITQPFNEGEERGWRGIFGVNRHLLSKPKISLKDRVVYLVVGFFLMVPLIGTIIWIAMRFFSNPEFLSAPFVHRTTPDPRFSVEIKDSRKQPMRRLVHQSSSNLSLSGVHRSARAAKTTKKTPIRPTLPKSAIYFDERKKGAKIKADWTFEKKGEELFTAKSHSAEATTESHYLNNRIQQYHYTSHTGQGELILTLLGKSIHLQGKRATKNSEEIEEFTKDYPIGDTPWIQQTTLGFQEFILSDEQELEFYGIHPEEFTLTTLKAVKKGIETLDGHGEVRHMQIRLHSVLTVVDAWFSLSNGILVKSVAKTGLMSRMITELSK